MPSKCPTLCGISARFPGPVDRAQGSVVAGWAPDAEKGGEGFEELSGAPGDSLY